MRKLWPLLLLASCNGAPVEMTLDEYAAHVEEKTGGGFIITGVVTDYALSFNTDKQIPYGKDKHMQPVEIHDGETAVMFYMDPNEVDEAASGREIRVTGRFRHIKVQLARMSLKPVVNWWSGVAEKIEPAD